MPQDFYPADYFQARQRFRDLATCGAWETESYPIAGGEDSPLTVDIASRGPTSAPMLLISSGLHGVEGFFGSALQQSLLHQPLESFAGLRVVFIHALNPYGFMHRRRVNEANVDLNRNFLFGGESYAGSHPLYSRLNGLLNPPRANVIDLFYPRAAAAVIRHGMREVTGALVSGQYDHPQGIYFGGTEIAQTHQFLSDTIHEIVGDSQHIVHLDLHSGLGRYGDVMMMMEPGCQADAYAMARRAFQSHNVLLPSRNEKAYQARGNIGSWLQHQFADRSFLYFCAEFGTYAGVRVLKALCDENASFHADGLQSPRHNHAASRLLNHFVPRDIKWRERVEKTTRNIAATACKFLTA